MSKSQIKSKKQKINQKKFSKGNVQPLINLIQSSDDQHYKNNLKIQKRSKYSGKTAFSNSNSQSPKHYVPKPLDLSKVQSATFETKKLGQKVIYEANKKTQDGDTLLVVQTAQQQNPQTNSKQRSLYSYKVEGKQKITYVSQMHVIGRITAEMRHIQQKQQLKAKRQQDLFRRVIDGSFISDEQDNPNPQQPIELQNKQKTNQQPAQKKRAARYYQDALSDQEGQQNIVKCFRCYKKGHIAKNCIEQQPKIKCIFCLQQHHYSVCTTSPCFRCCQPGHISQDCNSKAPECYKCKKRGHKSDKCGVYIPLDYHSKNDDYIKNRFKKTDLKKLKCLCNCDKPEGHFNCFVYNSRKEIEPYAKISNKKIIFQKNMDTNRRPRNNPNSY